MNDKVNVIYTQNLKEKLNQVVKITETLAQEDPDKTLEQFIAETNFISSLLKDIRRDCCSY